MKFASRQLVDEVVVLPTGQWHLLSVRNDKQARGGLAFESNHHARLPLPGSGDKTVTADRHNAVVQRIVTGRSGHVASRAVRILRFHSKLLRQSDLSWVSRSTAQGGRHGELDHLGIILL